MGHKNKDKNNVVKMATLGNVPATSQVSDVPPVAHIDGHRTQPEIEPSNAEIKAIEKTDAVVKEKETLYAIVTTFHVALEKGKDALRNAVPTVNVDILASWSLWFGMFKELFVTYLVSLVPSAATGERVTLSAETWKVFHDFCRLVDVGYADDKGSKSMYPRMGATLIPYCVAAAFYVWLTKCRVSQTQEIITGKYRLSYDGGYFFLTLLSKPFENLGEYKTTLRLPEKVTEPQGNVTKKDEAKNEGA